MFHPSLEKGVNEDPVGDNPPETGQVLKSWAWQSTGFADGPEEG